MKRILSAWLPAAAWMILIFAFSNMNSNLSDLQSDAIAKPAQSFLSHFFGGIPYLTVTFFVRKTAHFLEYAILAMLFYRASGMTGFSRPLADAIVFSAIYAATDEFHQLFIDGRSSQLCDVLLDTAGAAAGALLYRRLIKRIRKKD